MRLVDTIAAENQRRNPASQTKEAACIDFKAVLDQLNSVHTGSAVPKQALAQLRTVLYP
jgi:hypothetical protein